MAKENFGQAMNELFGVGKTNGKTEEKIEKAAAKTENVVKETVASAAPSAEKNYQPQQFQWFQKSHFHRSLILTMEK